MAVPLQPKKAAIRRACSGAPFFKELCSPFVATGLDKSKKTDKA